jgi:hypothetical protein
MDVPLMLALLDPAFWEMNASLTVQRQRKWMTLPKTGAASMAATNWASPSRTDFSAVGDFGCDYPWEVVGLAAILLLFSYMVIF